jgi:serine/threonine protein kinase
MAQAEPSKVLARSGGGEDGAGGSGGTASNSDVNAPGGGEFVTAMSAPTSLSSEVCEYGTAGMSEVQIRDAIETSKVQGWSELRDGGPQGATASGRAEDDARAWEELKKRDPRVFRDFPEGDLKLGRMIAEGGQAQIFEASLDGDDERLVAKVFKREAFSLADLQRQWPLATKHPEHKKPDDDFVLGGVVFGEFIVYCSSSYWATLLKDGRFAFVMQRYWGDLRTLINLKMKENNFQGPPFSHETAKGIMFDIARGMKGLHGRGVLHRDLKAANILIWDDESIQLGGKYLCEVADYESAMLVEGTGFWRAPEVLQELLKNRSERDLGIWTEKVDVYSYAMTCYEVLTGEIPFPQYFKSDWKKVIDGKRPPFPDYVDSRLREIVERCWHKDPSCRPTFYSLLRELEKF